MTFMLEDSGVCRVKRTPKENGIRNLSSLIYSLGMATIEMPIDLDNNGKLIVTNNKLI